MARVWNFKYTGNYFTMNFDYVFLADTNIIDWWFCVPSCHTLCKL